MVHPTQYLVKKNPDGTEVKTNIPTEIDIGVYYGSQFVDKLKPVWLQIRNAAFGHEIGAYKNGEKEAYTRAFLAVLTGLGDAIETKPFLPTVSTGPTTIVHNEAQDNSWFGWTMFGIIALAFLAASILFLLHRRDEKGDQQSVAAETNRIRADCRSRLMSLNDETMLLDARVQKAATGAQHAELERMLASYKKHVADGIHEFRRFDNLESGDKPANMPLQVFMSNQQRYADIVVQFVEPAEAEQSKLEQLLGATDSVAA